MSELQTASADQDLVQSQDAQDKPEGAGELLKRAREAAGLHIAALAVMLKVPVKKLEALEANRLDLLPDAVFVRALAASVCRTLKIDAVPVLARLPQTDVHKLAYQGVGINEPFRSPGDGPGPTIWTQVSRPSVLAGLLLLLGALVLIFLPVIKTGVDQVKSEVVATRLPGIADATNTTNAINTLNTQSEKSSGSVLQGDVPFASVAPVPLADGATLAQSASDALSTTFVDPVKPPLDTDMVVFTARGQSWIEVTDAKGQVVLRRVLNAGESTGAAGALPLKVVVGRASETQVQIRGKAFDLNAVSKDNVARFEVK